MTQDHHHLSDLQLAIMRVLWEDGEATVAQVHRALESDRGLAPTTVATVLSRLEKRGLLAHRTEGRQFVYRCLVSEGDVKRSMVGDLADLLFEGDVTELVSHLLEGKDISPAGLARVRTLLAEHENKERGKADDPA